MLINYLKTILFVALMAIFTLSCGGGGKDDEKENDSTGGNDQVNVPKANDPVVCIWSSVTLRATPQIKGKYKNTIYLGEKATYMNEKATDSVDAKNKKEFVKIKLVDGTEGWVQSNMVAIGGKSYAVKEKTKLYKRPDVLAVGKDEFDRMQFVVSTEEQGEWVKIKGKKRADGWFKEGWVKLDRLTSDEVDITVAVLAERALMKDSEDKKLEALKEITDNSDFSNSIFISDVRDMSGQNLNQYENQNPSEQPQGDYIEGD